MERLRQHSGALFSVMMATLLTLVFITVELPGNTLFIGAMQNAGHTLAFFTLTWICLLVTRDRAYGVFALLLIACALLGIGVLIEVVQHISGRNFSGYDLVRNSLGVGAGYCLFLALQRVSPTKRIARYLLLFAAVGMIAMSLSKATALFVSGLLAPSVPRVITFDQWGANLRIAITGGRATVAHHGDIWTSNATESVKVLFNSKRWRVLQLLEPPADWTGYATLSYTVFNPSTATADIMFRIDEMDKASNLRDGMTMLKQISPGESVNTVNLAELRQRVATEFNYETPPLTQVSSITFFARGDTQAMELYFDDFTLQDNLP